MKIIHRYVLKETAKNIFLCSFGFCFLFLIIDFFDRIDNVLEENPSASLVFEYFLYKIPVFFNVTLPIAMMVGSMLTIGILSKNSEMTAMRAGGLRVFWIIKPVLILGFLLSLLSLTLTETVVPYCSRKVREIYNIDIKKKNEKGTFNQTDFWWRTGDTFFSADIFDTRDSTLHGLSRFQVTPDFIVNLRTDSALAHWTGPEYGWTMHDVTRYQFNIKDKQITTRLESITLPIDEKPEDFYAKELDPFTMSYSQLRTFIKKQEANGVSSANYLADLQAKISFPFVIFIVGLASIPFALRPARSGSLASSFIAGLIIGFSYFVLHSFSLAMGRAELWPPLLAAWAANILLGIIGVLLHLGAEAPE